MKVVLLLAGGMALLGLGILAMSGFIQGEFETVPEGVAWMRSLLNESVLG